MRRRHRETFTTIKTEGNLLPVELLQRIAEGEKVSWGRLGKCLKIDKKESFSGRYLPVEVFGGEKGVL